MAAAAAPVVLCSSLPVCVALASSAVAALARAAANHDAELSSLVSAAAEAAEEAVAEAGETSRRQFASVRAFAAAGVMMAADAGSSALQLAALREAVALLGDGPAAAQLAESASTLLLRFKQTLEPRMPVQRASTQIERGRPPVEPPAKLPPLGWPCPNEPGQTNLPGRGAGVVIAPEASKRYYKPWHRPLSQTKMWDLWHRAQSYEADSAWRECRRRLLRDARSLHLRVILVRTGFRAALAHSRRA